MSIIDDQALDIDLYQARMLIAFYKAGMKDVRGTMEAFTRKLPPNRKFMVNCGVERIVSYLKKLAITDSTIEVFKQVLPEIEFDEELCNYLKSINFAKEISVQGMDDGEICFAQQPVVSLTGPVGIIQYPEKKILSILNHDVRIASKSARVYIAAQGRPVAEFGGRRGPDNMSAEAGRAAYIAGFSSSSNVLAFAKYGVPCSGSMGHVFIMSFLDDSNGSGEDRAYETWGKLFKNASYLPDTYNLRNGVDKVLRNCRKNIGSIRLDVDKLKEESINVRRQLNQMDHFNVKIGATNDLNEYKIKELIEYGCPIDWFGVGTEVVSTPDAPTCNFIYKLVEVDDPVRGHQLVAKISDGSSKGTYPGAKQVFRHYSDNLHLGVGYRKFCFDEIGLVNEESRHSSYKLLRPFSLVNDSIGPSATTSRDFFISNLSKLPDEIKLIEKDEFNIYPVVFSKSLQEATSSFKSSRLK